MLKPKLNGFLQNGFKCRTISQIFQQFTRKSETNAFKKILFVGEKTWQPFGYLRAKIVIVGSNIHELQIIIPVLNNLTVLEYTKKIFTSVSLAQGVGYLPRREPPL